MNIEHILCYFLPEHIESSLLVICLLYSTDIILEVQGCKKTAKYNPVRGQQVIRYARDFLDQAVPLAVGSHHYVTKYKVSSGKLIAIMGDGSQTELGWRECFAGYSGEADAPSSILLRHNNLHIEILIGEGFYIGRSDLAHVYDVRIESAITTIMGNIHTRGLNPRS